MTAPDSFHSDEEPFISTCHWFTGSDRHSKSGVRSFLWVSATADSVALAEFGALVSDGSFTTADGQHWRRFELPHCHDPSVSQLEIEIVSSGRLSRATVEITSNLPSRELLEEAAQLKSQGEDDEADDLLDSNGFDELALGGIGILNLIDRHADMMYRLNQTEHSFAPYPEYSRNDLHIRSALRICNRWERIGRSRTPPLSLIVRLAAEIPDTIEHVCESPRVVLRRVRELEQAARIREVDQTCIRWLGRQPGRSLIQKAGTRQRLMAVVRKEDCDTPENRVVRDLLVRCKAAGRSYIARNTNFRRDDRIKSVQRLVTLCEKYLKHSQIKDVRKLVGIAQPNYVLQHEQRYQVLWDAYIRLVRQEQVTQSVWQWRDRVWLEWLTLALTSALKLMSSRSPGHRQGVAFADEPETGRYINSATFGPWWIGKGRFGSVFLVTGSDIAQSPLPDSVRQLQPDVGIVSNDLREPSVAIWTVLDVVNPVDTAIRLAEQLQAALPDKTDTECRLLVVVAGGTKIGRGSENDQIAWMTVPLMLQDSLDSWVRNISEYIGNV